MPCCVSSVFLSKMLKRTTNKLWQKSCLLYTSVEDAKIRKYLNVRLAKASISKIIIERTLKLDVYKRQDQDRSAPRGVQEADGRSR